MTIGNVLISSAGDKIPLYRCVRDASLRVNPVIKVFCGDSNTNSLSRYISEDFWQMKAISDYESHEMVKELLERDIRIVIPTRDGELLFWSNIKHKLREVGIIVVVSETATLQICLDKLNFSNFLSENGFNWIPTWSDIDSIKSKRVVVKERFATDSKLTKINIPIQDVQRISTTNRNPVFQEYIEGNEISVDIWAMGQIHITASARTREVIKRGEAVVTRRFENSSLEETAVRMARSLKIEGPAVIQFIQTPEGEFYPIECNARFGGASTFSVVTKHDSIYKQFCEIFQVIPNGTKRSSTTSIQVRVPTDYYLK
jgi:carbamoyl-phosphate synthase large subunit